MRTLAHRDCHKRADFSSRNLRRASCTTGWRKREAARAELRRRHILAVCSEAIGQVHPMGVYGRGLRADLTLDGGPV